MGETGAHDDAVRGGHHAAGPAEISRQRQFVAPDLGSVSLQFLILGITFVLADLVIDGLIGLASGRLTRALRRSRHVARGLNVISGTVLAGLAIRLIAAQR